MDKNIAFCPDCGGEIRFKRIPFVGQDITCRHCNTALVVVSKTPIELDWADYEEDWEEEEVDSYSNQNSSYHQK